MLILKKNFTKTPNKKRIIQQIKTRKPTASKQKEGK